MERSSDVLVVGETVGMGTSRSKTESQLTNLKSDRDLHASKMLATGKTDAELMKTVTEGGEDMPPFGKKLSKEQIETLVKNDVRGFAPRK